MKTHIGYLVLIAAITMTITQAQVLWKDAYQRGVGLASYCPNAIDTLVVASRLCYPPCPSTALTPSGSNCLTNCPGPGFSDTGTTCTHSLGGSFGRGVGYAFSNINACNNDQQNGGYSWYTVATGCEINGLIAYPTCPIGYNNVLCCICQTNGCPAPMTGGGPCNKQVITNPPRGPSMCAPGLEFGANNLCYPPCINGFTGLNEICWENCPASSPTVCSVSLCSNSACSPAQTASAVALESIVLTASTAGALFSMETILRASAPALATSGQLADQALSFTAFDASMALPHLCMDRRFPVYLGSTAGQTQIQAFEIDLHGNIGLGGVSADLSLVTSSGAMFAGMLNYTGFNFTWVTQFNIANQVVSQIIFNSDGKKMAVLLTPSPLTIVVLNSIDGTIFSQAKDSASSQSSGQGSLSVDLASNWLMLATNGLASEMTLVGMNLFNSATPSTFSTVTVPNYLTTTVSQIAGTSIYLGGVANLAQIPPSSNIMQCMAISQFTFSVSTGGVWSASYVSTSYNGQAFTPDMLKYASGGILFASAHATAAGGENGLLLMKSPIPSGTVESYIYQENLGDSLLSLDLFPVDIFNIYVVLKNSVRNTFTVLTVKFGDGTIVPTGQIQYSQRLISNPKFTFANTLFAKLTSVGEFYVTGIPSFSTTCMTVVPGGPGFLAYSNFDSSCQTFSSIIGTLTSPVAFTAMTFQTYSFPQSSSSMSLSISSVIGVPIVQTKLYLTPNTCCLRTITTTVMPYHRYIIDYPPSKFTLAPFTIDPVCTDNFPFWYKRVSTPLLPTPLPIFFDDINLFFIAQTQTASDAGIYTITVTGTLPNHQSSTSPGYQIELFNIPPATTIKSYQMESQNYIATDVPLNFTSSAYLSSDLTYYIIYYLEIMDVYTGLYSRSIDTQLFTFEQGGLSPNISIYTLNNTKKGVYSMRIMGKFTPNTAFQAISIFKIAILDQCYLTKIKPSKLPEEIIFVMQSPGAAPLVIQFKEWTESLGVCTPFTYRSNLLNGGYLPNFVKFNSAIKQFQITQTSNMAPGFYSIRLTGQLSNVYMSAQVFTSLIIKCSVGSLKSPQTINKINYFAGTPALYFPIIDFIQDPLCSTEVSYSATLQNGQPLDPKYITFTQASNSLGIIQRQIIIKAPQYSKATQFQVQILAQIQDDGGVQKMVMGIFKLTVNVKTSKQFVVTSYPQKYLTMKGGEQLQVPFETASSSDSTRRILTQAPLNMTINKSVIKLISGARSNESVQFVPSNEPSTSFDGSTGILTISPNQNVKDGTRYLVQAIVQDGPGIQFRITQNMFVIISRNSQMDNLLALMGETMSEFGFLPNETVQSIWSGSKLNISAVSDPQLKARIQTIDLNGLVTLQFSKPIVIVKNITFIDEEVLNLTVKSSYGKKDARDLSFTWVVINMTQNTLQLRLKFANPIVISAYEVTFTFTIIQIMDMLNVNFLQNEFFVTNQPGSDTYSPIKQYLQISKKIPRQLNYDDITVVDGAKKASSSFFGFLFGNFFLTLLFASSMQGIWSLIQVSQLMMLIPLIKINLPANAQSVFFQFQQIISFNLVDPNTIPYYNQVFQFDDILEGSDDYDSMSTSYGQRFDDYGISSFSTVKNMGAALVFMFISIVYQILLFVICKILNAFNCEYQFMKKLEKDTFFNMSIRGLIEMALELFIYSLINILNPSFKSSTDIFSFSISVFFLLALIVLLVCSFIITTRISIYGQKQITGSEQVSCIYEQVRHNDRHRLNYQPYSILRRILIVLMLIFLKDYTVAQIYIFMIQSLFFTAYVLFYRPFEDSRIQRLESFNEFMLLMATGQLFAYTDYGNNITDPNSVIATYQFGWGLCGIMLITIAFNTLYVTAGVLKQLWMRVSYTYRKCKARYRKKAQLEKVLAIKPHKSLLDEDNVIKPHKSLLEEDDNEKVNEIHYKRAVKTLLDEEPEADITEPKHARQIANTAFSSMFEMKSTVSIVPNRQAIHAKKIIRAPDDDQL